MDTMLQRDKSKKRRPKEKEQLPPISPARQRYMSDEKIRFAIVDGSQSPSGRTTIHTKRCNMVRRVPDRYVHWLTDYEINTNACPVCELQAYLIWKAKDPGKLEDYQDFLFELGFTADLVRQLYCYTDVTTEMVGKDTIKIRCGKDRWLLKRNPQDIREVWLLHNNYHTDDEGSRDFYAGYHLQKASRHVKELVDLMSSYAYGKHILRTPKEERPPNVDIEAIQAEVEEVPLSVRLLRKTLAYTHQR